MRIRIRVKSNYGEIFGCTFDFSIEPISNIKKLSRKNLTMLDDASIIRGVGEVGECD